MQRNLQTLGVLWCVFGAYRLITGIAGMMFLRSIFWYRHIGNTWPFESWGGVDWLAPLIPFAGTMIAISAVLALLTGYALLTRKPWGRTFAIVIAVLTLLKPVLGTALGIYTLWLLAPYASRVEYDALADQS